MAKQNTKNADTSATDAAGTYPFNNYEQCIKLGKIVQECGGASGPVPKSVIAHRLKMGEKSSGFYAQIASTRLFGIIDGVRDVQLTEAGRNYFHPTDDFSKRRAELKFFSTPGAFRPLIQRFDGHQLPPTDILTNHLLLAKIVPKSWTERVAQIFRTTAASFGLIDSSGFLRYSVAMHEAGKPPAGHHEEGSAVQVADMPVTPNVQAPLVATPPASQSPAQNYPAKVSVDSGKNVWVFAGGLIRLETPDPLSRQMWEKLKQYVGVLEPFTETTETAEESRGGIT